MDAIRQLAALDGESPSLMLAVLDDLREIVEREIDADLVEVSPGAFLPSHEARELIARREREREACSKSTPGCSVDHSTGDDICETW